MNINRNTFDLSKIASKLATGKWMLPPANHTALCRLVQSYMEGEISLQQIPNMPNIQDQPIAGTSDPDYPIAVISVSGILSKGVSEMEEHMLGLTDVDYITEALEEAANDPTVKDIYLVLSSPGGETVGIEELGRKIRYIDENIKPVCGWTESQAASAAYWLLSQCGRTGMTPSSQVGSVGVYSLVQNNTEQMKQQGLKLEIFYSGKWKMMGHEFRDLSDSERDYIQKDVEKQHEKFKQVVLSKRPSIKEEDLEGLSFEGEDALEKGFVDELHDSFEEFLANNAR